MFTHTHFFALCYLCLMLAACTFDSPLAENQADKRTSRSIIRAIDQYQIEHGVLPAELHVLVPNYLPALPKTTHNRDFVYRKFHDTDRGDDYELCFYDGPKRSSRDYGCCYMHYFDNPPHYDGWDCTGGDG